MIDLLRQTWWKYLGALLLLIVIIGGMLVPMGPGVTRISPVSISLSAQPHTLSVSGFNTHFKQAPDLQLWFKNGNEYYLAKNLTILSDTKIKCTFTATLADRPLFHSNTFDIVVNDKIDGTLAMRDGLALMPTDSGLVDTTASALTSSTPEVTNGKYAGFSFPFREILYQSLRNLFFHVPMWFGMTLLVLVSIVFSIMYLSTSRPEYDIYASQAVLVGLLFGMMGIFTGMTWATYTWGEPWPNDPKLNGAAVGIIIYLAYIVLRGSISDPIKRARISAVYNVFSIVIFILFIYILPRLTDSLHPGNGGNPAFKSYDLDSHLRLFFYPAVIGWILMGLWLTSIGIRIKLLELKRDSL